MSGKALSAEHAQKIGRLKGDFPHFAEHCLRILDADGKVKKLTLNRAQIHLESQIQLQAQETGMVRIIVLKGRRQGISTYTEGRFFWKIWSERGKRAFILTHEQAASDKIFEMSKRFHDLMPAGLQHSTAKSNAKALFFDQIDCGFEVATAGSKDTGRGAAAQYFHGSEVAFWDNGEDHMAGLGQVVQRRPGTEIILESTANGMGNLFHRLWQEAEKGTSDYRAVFIPWFWEPSYKADAKGFTRTEEEELYARAHQLTNDQLAWRRAKIFSEFAGDFDRFRQEYPATAAEAFVMVGHEPFIAPRLILEARVCTSAPEGGPLVIGVDPARFGDDSTAIVRRRGRRMFQNFERLRNQDLMQVAGRVANIIRTENPQRVFIDIGGLGAGVYDRLRELGFGDVVMGVNFASQASRAEIYANKRAEMWGDTKEWFREGQCFVPSDDTLLGDLTGPQFSYDSQGRLKLESKDDMRKRGVKSPDLGDALALTFAYPVASAASRNSNAWTELEEAWSEASDMSDRTGFHTG